MVNRKFGKNSDSSDSVTQQGGVATKGEGAFLPRISVGPRRYSRLSVGWGGAVYSVYLETKKKLMGYAWYDGKVFTPCGIGLVIKILGDESKNKTKRSVARSKVQANRRK